MIHALMLRFRRFHKLAFHALRIRFPLYFLGVKYNIFHVKLITTRNAQLPTFLFNANQETDNNIFFDVSANLSVIQIHLKRLFKVAPCFRQPFFSPLKDKNWQKLMTLLKYPNSLSMLKKSAIVHHLLLQTQITFENKWQEETKVYSQASRIFDWSRGSLMWHLSFEHVN